MIELVQLRAKYDLQHYVCLYLDELSYYRQPTLSRDRESQGQEQPLARHRHKSDPCFCRINYNFMKSETSQNKSYEIWKNAELSKTYLEGVRGAIPLAAEQIDCFLRVIRLTQPQVKTFLDLGCGNGILGKAIQQSYPDAQGVFLDISSSMLETAKNNTFSQSHPVFILQDFGRKDWIESVKKLSPFDVIVSGFAIHHQPDVRKRKIYEEVYELLKLGGIFLNLEHVASRSQLGKNAFDELFIDALYTFHKKQGSQHSREEIGQQYYNRTDKNANILTLVETQCEWLKEIGFVQVDCFMKLFEIALFGGLKVEGAECTAAFQPECI